MKNKTTMMGGLFGCIALALTACGPSPDAICDKMVELAKKDGASEAMVKKMEEDRGECVSSMESAKEMQGMMKFKEKGNCIMDAENLKAAIACE